MSKISTKPKRGFSFRIILANDGGVIESKDYTHIDFLREDFPRLFDEFYEKVKEYWQKEFGWMREKVTELKED